MARSQSERIDEIVPRKETKVKQKLLDKINTLGADTNTTAKDLTYLSKSLEVLNKQIKEDTFTGGSGPDDYSNRPKLQEVPHASMPGWNVGKGTMGRNQPAAQFGVYTSGPMWSCGITVYDETTEPVAHTRWTWCHHYGAGAGGQWGPWSTGQRNACTSWNSNNCYFNTQSHTSSHHCYNNGTDSVGPLGHSNLVTGAAAPLAKRFWCHSSNQATGIGPCAEYRNEQVETGNCEPTDKYTYIIYQGSTIRLRNRRLLPGASVDYSQHPTVNGDTNSYGSLTHNFSRGELAVLNRDSAILDQNGDSGYYFKTKIYKNLPEINLQTDLGVALNDTTAKVIISRIEDGGDQGMHEAAGIGMEYSTHGRAVYPDTMFQQAGRIEGREGIKICMVDNGDIYWSVTSSACHSLHKCTRYTVDGVTDDDYYDWGFVPTYSKTAAMRGYKDQDEYLNENVIGYDRRPEPVDYHGLNDFYGRESGGDHANGVTYGCSHVGIPSRNHKNVILSCAYYNYGSGMSSWIIDRRFSRWQIAWYVRDSTYGCQWGPFAEEGFVASYARNGDGDDCAYRLYIFRQDLNTGIWQRSEMSRATSERIPATTHYPTLIPIY